MDRRKVLVVAAALIAAMGTALVFLYARGADSRAAAAYETTKVLVATSTIPRGESVQQAVTSGQLALRPVANGNVLPGAATTTTKISDKVALTDIYAGEQIIPEKLGDSAAEDPTLLIPDKEMAMSVELTDPARVAGFVKPGAQVAIFVYSGNGTSMQPTNDPTKMAAFSRMLLPRATVVAVGSSAPTSSADTTQTDASSSDSSSSSTSSQDEIPNTLMTLALTQRESEQVLAAQSVGVLSFALLTKDSQTSSTDGVTAATLFDKK